MIAAGDHQDSPDKVTPGVSAIAAMKVSKGIRSHTDQARVFHALKSKNAAVVTR